MRRRSVLAARRQLWLLPMTLKASENTRTKAAVLALVRNSLISTSAVTHNAELASVLCIPAVGDTQNFVRWRMSHQI
jgi:hypothetical protein